MKLLSRRSWVGRLAILMVGTAAMVSGQAQATSYTPDSFVPDNGSPSTVDFNYLSEGTVGIGNKQPRTSSTAPIANDTAKASFADISGARAITSPTALSEKATDFTSFAWAGEEITFYAMMLIGIGLLFVVRRFRRFDRRPRGAYPH